MYRFVQIKKSGFSNNFEPREERSSTPTIHSWGERAQSEGQKGWKNSSNSFECPSLKLLICLVLACMTLYAFIAKGNQVTEIRLAIPALAKKVRILREENSRLSYEIEQFESPIHLMEIMHRAELSHLKFPHDAEVIALPEPHPLDAIDG